MELDGDSDDEVNKNKIYTNYVSIPYGFQFLSEYCHSSKHCDIQGITYNNKTKEYIILDSRGISSWLYSIISSKTKRVLDFEAYKFNSIQSLIYSRHHNVFFALTKEYNLKVFNHNFHEISSAESDGNTVSKLLYNPVDNELVAVCRSKLRFWKYSLREQNSSYHGLILLREFDVAESLLVSNAEIDVDLNRIYLLCDNDIWCYSMCGRQYFHLKSPSSVYFSACSYSKDANLVIAGSINGQLSIYSPTGGLVTTLLNHSRIVTSISVHPQDGFLFLSASMDGTVKLFSLQMLDELYSVNVFPDGVYWMRIQSNNLLYCSSRKSLKLYNLNYTFRFWSTVRCPVNKMSVVEKEPHKKSYVLVNATDSTIRLYSKNSGQRRCTILPPPEINSAKEILSTTFDRGGRVLYFLFSPSQLWIYSTRTDPATRVATWNIEQSLRMYSEDEKWNKENRASDCDQYVSRELEFGASTMSQRQANENIKCCCLMTIRREVFVAQEEASESSFLNFGFLLCGLTNGILCFLDPCHNGKVFKSLRVHSTCPVKDIRVYYGRDFTHFATLIQTSDSRLVRIWNASTFACFTEILLPDNVSVYTYKHRMFATGQSNGRLIFKHVDETNEIEESPEEKVFESLLFQNNVGEQHHSAEISSAKKRKRRLTHKIKCIELNSNEDVKEHTDEVLSIDILPGKKVIVTCGMDGFVRIWNFDKELLTEIKFDSTLRSALFLKENGTVLISFKSQLFVIPNYVISYGVQNLYESFGSSGSESFIYEDPYVTRDRRSSRPPLSVTLSNYLIPYPNLGLESLWMFEKAITDQEESTNLQNSQDNLYDSDDTLDSFASTAIYQESLCSSKSVKEIDFPRCSSTPLKEDVLDDEPDLIDELPSIATVDSPQCVPESQIQPIETTKQEFIPPVQSFYDLIRNKSIQNINSNQPLPPRTKKSSNKTTKNSIDKPTDNMFSNEKPKRRKKRKKQHKKMKPTTQQTHDNKYRDDGEDGKIKESIEEPDINSIRTGEGSFLGKGESDLETLLETEGNKANVTNITELPDLKLPEQQDELSLPKPADLNSTESNYEDALARSGKTVSSTSSRTFSLHHKSLTAMAMGKSERSISHSYKNVLRLLTISPPSCPTDSYTPFSRLSMNSPKTVKNLDTYQESDGIGTQNDMNEDIFKIMCHESDDTVLNFTEEMNTDQRDNGHSPNITNAIETKDNKPEEQPVFIEAHCSRQYKKKKFSVKIPSGSPKQTPRSSSRCSSRTSSQLSTSPNQGLGSDSPEGSSTVTIKFHNKQSVINDSNNKTSQKYLSEYDSSNGKSDDVESFHRVRYGGIKDPDDESNLISLSKLSTLRFDDESTVGKGDTYVIKKVTEISDNIFTDSHKIHENNNKQSNKKNETSPPKKTFKALTVKHLKEIIATSKVKYHSKNNTDYLESSVLMLTEKLKETMLQSSKVLTDPLIKCVSLANSTSKSNDQGKRVSTSTENDSTLRPNKVSVALHTSSQSSSRSQSRKNSRSEGSVTEDNTSCGRKKKSSTDAFHLLAEKSIHKHQPITGGALKLESKPIVVESPVAAIETGDFLKASTNEEKKHVMNFILSAFNKQKPRPPTHNKNKTRKSSYQRSTPENITSPQLFDSISGQGEQPKINKHNYHEYQGPLSSTDSMNIDKNSVNLKHYYSTDETYFTPRTSVQYSPVSKAFICHRNRGVTDGNNNFETDTDDDSHIVSDVEVTYRGGSTDVLYSRLSKHKCDKQKRKSREEMCRIRRQLSSTLSSGYETQSYETFLGRSSMFINRSKSSIASRRKQRLTIKKSPLAIECHHNNNENDYLKQHPIELDSEQVYYDFAKSNKSPQTEKKQQITEKQEKIRNLEMKLSGQPFRYQRTKITTAEMETDNLILQLLKKQNKNAPITPARTSVSIPIRCQYKLVRDEPKATKYK